MTDKLITAADDFSIEASADGKRNAFCHGCAAIQQSMSYAACVNRVTTIQRADKGFDVKVPRDWAECDRAMGRGTCPAVSMRSDEVAAGKSLYFQARATVQAAADAAIKWVSSWSEAAPAKRAAAPRKPASMLDAMGDAGSFADAINVASPSTPAAAPVRPVLPKAILGETPLAMARRLAIAKAANA